MKQPRFGFAKSGTFGGRGAHRGVGGAAAGLNLTPMIDMLTIMLVFLIKTYSVSPAYLTPTQNIQLAITQSDTAAPDKAVLIIGKEGVLLEGKVILKFKNGEVDGHDLKNGELPDLLKALTALANKTKFIASKNASVQFSGTLILQADKEIPFDSLKPILRTAGLAGFNDIKFAGVYPD